MYIIDRTKNPSGKSIPNTRRFMQRAKDQISESIAAFIQNETIVDSAEGRGNVIYVKGNRIHEPHFWIDNDASDWKKVFPGNTSEEDYNLLRAPVISYIEEDEIDKPPSSSGRGRSGSSDGDMTDDFLFQLSEEDWNKFLFDQLNLPNRDDTKTVLNTLQWRKAGFTLTGNPANLSLIRTMRNSFGRRIGLRRPTTEDITALEKKIEETTDPDQLKELKLELSAMMRRIEFIPWIDPIDVRYATQVKEVKPKFNAVMFCLMDVSGSMSEHMKDLAKRFYVFLYKFLKSKYEKVEIVFIRHTHKAEEVDEDTFFYDPESGGTVVSTALEEMIRVQRDRYPLDKWNIYCAQASDGDNYSSDNLKTIELINSQILPMCQYMTYIEVNRSHTNSNYYDVDLINSSDLWKTYAPIAKINSDKFVMEKINSKDDIWKVMIKLFGEKT